MQLPSNSNIWNSEHVLLRDKFKQRFLLIWKSKNKWGGEIEVVRDKADKETMKTKKFITFVYLAFICKFLDSQLWFFGKQGFQFPPLFFFFF